MEIRCAKVTNEDYEVFKEMHENFRYASEDGHELPRKPVLDSYEKYAKTAEREWIYFAVENGEEIGYTILTAYDDGEVRIEEIYIKKVIQRRGLGRKFVGLILEMLKEEGFKRATIFSVSIATDGFWFRCRFRPINHSDEFEFILV